MCCALILQTHFSVQVQRAFHGTRKSTKTFPLRQTLGGVEREWIASADRAVYFAHTVWVLTPRNYANHVTAQTHPWIFVSGFYTKCKVQMCWTFCQLQYLGRYPSKKKNYILILLYSFFKLCKHLTSHIFCQRISERFFFFFFK